LHADRAHQSTVGVVIPAKDEEKNIAWVLSRLPAMVDEVIVVDGRSTDGTVRSTLENRPDARVVRQPGRGKGDAIRAGLLASRAEIVVLLDADGSMHPREIPRFVHMIENGFDVVKGSRFLLGGGSSDITWVRRAGNELFRVLVNVLYGMHFTDLCYGYFALRRDCLPQLLLRSEGFEIETEFTLRAIRSKLRICEVPSFEATRHTGLSQLRTFRDGARVLGTLIGDRISMPLDKTINLLDEPFGTFEAAYDSFEGPSNVEALPVSAVS